MRLVKVRQVVVAAALLSNALLVQTLPVAAVTTGPTVIAVHRNGAVDVSGNTTFGTIARMSVPAGNWSMTATATIVGTDSTGRVECQLVAGTEFYKSRTVPSAQGAGSSQSIVMLLAHHFAKTGTVTLKCYSDGWTGDVLIRDVHVAAVQVGQLTDNGLATGTERPGGRYAQDTTFTAVPGHVPKSCPGHVPVCRKMARARRGVGGVRRRRCPS